MNIILFGLTGLCNDILKALLRINDIKINAVFTISYKNSFPYYREQQLRELCSELNITCFEDISVSSNEGINLIQTFNPDMIIVSTFKQIIKPDVIKIPRLGIINIHPSLLPFFRGPNPVENAILKGKKTTGITFHYLVDKIDAGNILLQKKIRVKKTDTNGTLRKRLSILASTMIPELMGIFKSGIKPEGKKQNERLASYAPKPKPEDGFLENCETIKEIDLKLRALNPYPGTSILLNGNRISVNRFAVLDKNNSAKMAQMGDYIDFFIDSKEIRLYNNF